MARVIRVSDLINVAAPVVVWTDKVSSPESVVHSPESGVRSPAKDTNTQTSNGVEFYMGQVAAVVGMAGTNVLNNRAALKQLEKIVHNYKQK